MIRTDKIEPRDSAREGWLRCANMLRRETLRNRRTSQTPLESAIGVLSAYYALFIRDALGTDFDCHLDEAFASLTDWPETMALCPSTIV